MGFEWDGEVMVQSDRTDAYRAALDRLEADGWVYGCGWTRREIAGEGRYPGHCVNGLTAGRQPRAWRVRTTAGPVEFADAVQGLHRQNVAAEVGDFVLLRADCYFAY
jgi:glutamyl-Q tRNA(Asp) synthetase